MGQEKRKEGGAGAAGIEGDVPTLGGNSVSLDAKQSDEASGSKSLNWGFTPRFTSSAFGSWHHSDLNVELKPKGELANKGRISSAV